MVTLTDEKFLVEVDHLIHGRPTELVVTPPPVTPPVEVPPVVVIEPVVPPVVEPVTPVTPPVVEPVAPVVVEPQLDAEGKPVVVEPVTPELDANGQPVVAPIVPAEPDYKAIHQRLFNTPIRAGGQDITIADADEAISLIQKGVGFHSKMNRLQGDLKYVEMLRNNDLLDESKLSLLIDAQAGKPGAIKKLLDVAKIDPLTLDSAEASTYAPSDHRVSDEQVRFQGVVSELSETAHGATILQEAQRWDQASKAEVYKNPDVLGFLATQKESGRYDLIKAQVDRAKAVGTIPVSESFLVSYTRVGQQMMQAGAFGPKPVTPTPTPVAQKIVTPTVPANARKAAAAAPTKVTTPGAPPAVDIKPMTDDEFMKHFKKTMKI